MAVRKKQKSFLDEFLQVKRVDGISIKDRSISLNLTEAKITKSETLKLIAIVDPVYGEGKNIEWRRIRNERNSGN